MYGLLLYKRFAILKGHIFKLDSIVSPLPDLCIPQDVWLLLRSLLFQNRKYNLKGNILNFAALPHFAYTNNRADGEAGQMCGSVAL